MKEESLQWDSQEGWHPWIASYCTNFYTRFCGLRECDMKDILVEFWSLEMYQKQYPHHPASPLLVTIPEDLIFDKA